MPNLKPTHIAALERFRNAMNLVGPGDVNFHFEDCEKALAGLQPTGHWADLGTGAGFPGLVFADLHPEVQLDLVDSRRKRCWFLEYVINEAGGREHLTVRCTRVERLPDATYDGLISRAFAPVPRVLEHARRLLRPGGRVVLFLQDDGSLQLDADFVVESEHGYSLHGKRRRAVTLVWTHTG